MGAELRVGRATRSRNAVEDNRQREQVGTSRSVGEAPRIGEPGRCPVGGRARPPVFALARQVRQSESEEILNLSERQDDRVREPFFQVRVERDVPAGQGGPAVGRDGRIHGVCGRRTSPPVFAAHVTDAIRRRRARLFSCAHCRSSGTIDIGSRTDGRHRVGAPIRLSSYESIDLLTRVLEIANESLSAKLSR
jgi:hypothetical protein